MLPDSRMWVAVGDVHGCLDELEDLLRLLSYNPSQHRLLFCGDLVDRGPDPVGVVRRVMRLRADCVQSNHDEKVARWRDHEAARAKTGKKNPMQVRQIRQDQWRQFSTEEVEWLRRLPPFIRFCDGKWLAVHAGFEWCRPPENQYLKDVIRLRFVDDAGKYLTVHASGGIPDKGSYWSEVWKGPESVVYGHAVHGLVDPRVDEPTPGIFCYGIDTGGCFGGNLTALLIDPAAHPKDAKWVSVPARAKYAELRTDHDPLAP